MYLTFQDNNTFLSHTCDPFHPDTLDLQRMDKTKKTEVSWSGLQVILSNTSASAVTEQNLEFFVPDNLPAVKWPNFQIHSDFILIESLSVLPMLISVGRRLKKALLNGKNWSENLLRICLCKPRHSLEFIRYRSSLVITEHIQPNVKFTPAIAMFEEPVSIKNSNCRENKFKIF